MMKLKHNINIKFFELVITELKVISHPLLGLQLPHLSYNRVEKCEILGFVKIFLRPVSLNYNFAKDNILEGFRIVGDPLVGVSLHNSYIMSHQFAKCLTKEAFLVLLFRSQQFLKFHTSSFCDIIDHFFTIFRHLNFSEQCTFPWESFLWLA